MIKSSTVLALLASTITVTTCAFQRACTVARRVPYFTHFRYNPCRSSSTLPSELSGVPLPLGHAYALVISKRLADVASSSLPEGSLKKELMRKHVDVQELKQDIVRGTLQLIAMQQQHFHPASVKSARERLNAQKALLKNLAS